MAKKIVILGAGYAGILTAQETRKLFTGDSVEITIVNKYPFHQLVTELHMPAAGSAPVKHVRLPLDKLVPGNVKVHIGEVSAILPDENTVQLSDGSTLNFDVLVVALGSETEYFGIPGLKENSFVLKSTEDATRIREHVESCLKKYTETKDESYLTFVVGGAGLTGIELIGEFADMLPKQCQKYGIPFGQVKLYSVEAAPSILPGFPEDLVGRARQSLSARGVQFLTGVPVVQLDEAAAHLKDGQTIPTRTLIWTGGVRGNSIVASSGIAVDGRGRAQINDFLQSQSHSNVFVVGDSAIFFNKAENRPYPPTAQIAWQMGVACGRNIQAYLNGSSLTSFVPHLQGTLASLGRKDAIGMVTSRKIKLKGKPAAWMKGASNLRYLATIGGLFSRV